MSKLTKTEWLARGESYKEASDHLLQSWTDDCVEMEQAVLVAVSLMRKADECFNKAERENHE